MSQSNFPQGTSGLRRALISVSDKSGVIEFARGLNKLGFEIISTGGTMKSLADAGVSVRSVSEITGVPEILGGRVKTLHPAIFGGILARRELMEDLETLKEHGIGEIDVVAVNLYPFEKTAAKPGTADEEIIEQIDIGGPSLLRAAAKNHHHLYAVVDPKDYPEVLQAVGEGRDADGRSLRRRLAAKVFAHCSAYDRAIGAYLGCKGKSEDSEHPNLASQIETLPERLMISWPLGQKLRYGENPHQQAAFYADPCAGAPSLAHCKQLQGKELSYNNYLDGEAALEMAREFEEPFAVIMKHANPCGAGRGATLTEAYQRAFHGDSVSAFGGIVGLNRAVDSATAEAMAESFLEVIIAPEFEEPALKILAKKKNLRLLSAGKLTPRNPGVSYRSVSGGLLAQETDVALVPRELMTVITKAQPTAEDWEGLLFAWKICRWVRSNAIVYASREKTLGIGAGQMSRIDAARFGMMKAEGGVKGAYVASDGFFPFRDTVDMLAKAGVRAIIQPGGSLRDDESIQAANEHGLMMVFTGQRHFRH